VDDRVHLCIAATAILEKEREELAGLLDAEERARADAFVRPGARDRFVFAHGFLRRCLSAREKVPPGDWRFVADAHGKPRIAAPDSKFHFSLSHTRGAVAVAIDHSPLGVDVESLARPAEVDKLARRYFAPEEIEALARLPAAERRVAFFACWTLKEAYVKGIGVGLSKPLSRFAFDVLDAIREGGFFQKEKIAISNRVQEPELSRYVGEGATPGAFPAGLTPPRLRYDLDAPGGCWSFSSARWGDFLFGVAARGEARDVALTWNGGP
jgi:4'-phosphopantetheinyl transferase